MIEETDARRQLEAYAATQPGVWIRVGPLLRILDAAASAGETLADLRDQQAQFRLQGLYWTFTDGKIHSKSASLDTAVPHARVRPGGLRPSPPRDDSLSVTVAIARAAARPVVFVDRLRFERRTGGRFVGGQPTAAG